MSEMTTAQKALALNALGWSDFAIKIRETGEWYAVCAGEISDGHVLKSTMGNGRNPEMAIASLWSCMTSLEPGERIVLLRDGERRAVRWNGFMWEPFNEGRQESREHNG